MITSNTVLTHGKQAPQSTSLFASHAFSMDAPELVSALRMSMRMLRALCAVDACAILLATPDESEWLVFTQQGDDGDGSLRSVRRSCATTLEACVLRQGEPVYVADIQQIGQGEPISELQHSADWSACEGSLLCVPLSLLDQDGVRQQIGVVTLAAEPHYFSAERIQLCTLYADQCSLTLRSLQQAHEAEFMRMQQERAQSRFMSVLAHELRAPLNAINGYLDITLEGVGGELNAEQHEFVQRARAGSEQLYALLEDLLLIARADAGHLKLNAEIIAPGEIVRNAVEELELLARDQEIAIQVQIPERLPRLYADAVRLQQVVRNLLSNALYFTPPDGHVMLSAQLERAGHVVPAAERADGDDEGTSCVLLLRVADTGCGIAQKYQQRIFERYFQVPREDGGRSGGQGLGLAIVKMLVELHGGTVEVESEPGKGSSFICRLPCLLT